jgi:hypothetical protein
MPMLMPVFYVPLFIDGTEKEREFSLAALREMLEALVRVNVMWLATHPNDYVPLYKVGVRWEPERGTENWLSIPEIYRAYRNGVPVDCEDLAAARAAEIRYYGVPGLGKVRAKADIRGRVVNGQVRMHAFVRYPDGTVEDPSTKLGMPGGGAEQWEQEAPPAMVAAVQRAAKLAGAGRAPATRRELAQRIPRALLMRALVARYGREVA